MVCGNCKSVAKIPLFCNSCYQNAKLKSRKEGAIAELDFISNSIKDVTSKVGFSTPRQAVDFCLDIINQRKKVSGGKP